MEHRIDLTDLDTCKVTLWEDGEMIAYIDHTNDKTWFAEHYSLEQGEKLLDYLEDVSVDDITEWEQIKADKYDVRAEQGLYGYGY